MTNKALWILLACTVFAARAEPPSPEQERGYALMVAAILGQAHQALVLCGLSQGNDPFFAEGNPIQQNMVIHMNRVAPDDKAFPQMFYQTYQDAFRRSNPDFSPEKCGHLDEEAVNREKQRLLDRFAAPFGR